MSISSFPTITSLYHHQQQQSQQSQEAGPSHSQRYLYFAVRSGTKPGVYVDWYQAEKQLVNHPDPSVKTFSTRLAAEAFVAGWDGAGRHALPPTTPRPLRDHLAMSFPGAVNGAHPTSRRQSYHARLLASVPPPSDLDSEFGTLTQNQDVERATRPPSVSFRHSMVKISSPLRQEVDDDPIEELDTSSPRLPHLHKAASYIGIGGLLSPPTSPDKSAATKRLSVMERERPTKARGVSESGQWSSRSHRDFVTGTGTGLGLLSPPNSPPSIAVDKRTSISGRPRPPSRASGLWADATPVPEPKSTIPGAELFGDNTAPKFSRSSLRKSGVVMPVAATASTKRTSSSNSKSLHSNPSRSSLYSNASSSSSSLASNSSIGSNKASWGRQTSGQAQDRLSSLAENSKREMQFGDDLLPPPRPAFMKRTPSQTSIASNESTGSMCSMTSGSSAPSSSSMEFSTEPEHIIIEEGEEEKEDVMISCTKSDGDADGSVDSGSMKNFKNTNKKSGMGMLKRFAKALKIDKKSTDSRRGSL